MLPLLVLPGIVFAAGFAKQSLFLSRTDVTEGDTVQLYANINNESQTKFDGGLSFYDSDTKIGAVPVTLAAGEAETASVSWKPAAGTRSVTAKLVAKDGTVAETLSEKFVIKAPPSPKATGGQESLTAAVDSSESIQSSITGAVPQTSVVVTPLFSALDGVRNSIADAADAQIAATKPKIGQGSVEGAETGAPSSTDWLWNIVYTIYFYILTLVRFVVGSAAVFYPVVAIAFLYFMYRMFRLFARPKY